MATFTLPNTQTGGSQQIQAGSLQEAQQQAQSAGTWSPAAGTYGANSIGAYTPSSGGGSAPSAPAGTVAAPQSQQLASGINSLLGAIASGNKQAFDEAVRQFNQTFGLDQQKFAESVRQYNEGLAVTQAGLTGTYQGAQTQQAQLQAANIQAQRAATAQAWANIYGYTPQLDVTGNPIVVGAANGQPAATLAAQQQAYAQQLGAINAAAALQANPFRQQQVIGQLGRVLTGQGVAGFSAPNTVTGVGTVGGNTQGGLGYMSQLISDIRDPGANQASMQGILDAIPTPNKINSADFLRSAPSTQSMVLQGMQEKFGIDPTDALNQIKNTLPQATFASPTTAGGTFGQIKG